MPLPRRKPKSVFHSIAEMMGFGGKPHRRGFEEEK